MCIRDRDNIIPILLLGPALLGASIGIAAFAGALTGSSVLSGVSSLMGGSIMSDLESLAAMSEPLATVGTSLTAIAAGIALKATASRIGSSTASGGSVGSTSSGGGIYRNACVKVHYNQTINANGRTVTVTQTDVPDITETNIDGFDPNGHGEKSNRHEAPNGVLQGQTTKSVS